MTKARAWILAVLLILAWTAIPDEPASAEPTDCTVRYVEGLDGQPKAQCYDGDTLIPDTAMERMDR